MLRYAEDDGDVSGDEAFFFCLHVLPEVEVEFEFDVGVDEFDAGVDEVDELEVDEELVPARTGTGAFGAGEGIET